MSKLPVFALVGSPNVGKSTLFNVLTRSRNALVADRPGLTRDRNYGLSGMGTCPFIIIDTGGVEASDDSGRGGITGMLEQTQQAIVEADAIALLVDARTHLSATDRFVAQMLRNTGKPVVLALNKSEGIAIEQLDSEFYSLGLSSLQLISASHKLGIETGLLPALFEGIGAEYADHTESVDDSQQADQKIRVAVVGRPNVGKSTLINALLGEQRLLTLDQPGTTRDAIEIDFEFEDQAYCLIDTAGIRRKSRVTDVIEKFSIVKTLEAIERCQVAVMVLEGATLTDQDIHLADLVYEAGKSVVLVINKCDGLDRTQRRYAVEELAHRVPFLRFASILEVSALRKQGIVRMMRGVRDAYRAAGMKLSTPKLTQVLRALVLKQQPARKGRFRPRLRYAHQGGNYPLRVVIHGSSLQYLVDDYKRYLMRGFSQSLHIWGTPVCLIFKNSRNPYHDS